MKHALITGGTSGIGKGIAKYFAENGYAVVIAGSRDDGEAVARELGDNVAFKKVDIADEVQVRALFAGQESLDVLVNSAGIYLGNDPEGIAKTDAEHFEREWRINTLGTFLACKHAMPLLRRARGNVINISSVSGMIAEPFALGYGSSKAAVDSMTKSLALAHVADGVRVNAICPGPIDTPMLRTSFGGRLEGNPEYEDWIKDNPMRRYGAVEDVVKAVAYLADPENTYVTGVLLPVDGGWSAKAL